MKIPELLAPAGSWEAFIASVEAGADAVYMGGKMFSARRYASNFDDKQLAEAVEYAHVRGVKIHVTVNTLVKDDEFSELLEFVVFLHDIGVDAVIVQDLGVAHILRKTVPRLPIHASTQMTVHNIEGALLAKELGCERIVLARELSISQIQEIREAVDAEIEVFVHGALCFAYSGQCLMSSLIGGRSGNRGMCAQPCRMEYRILENGTVLQDVPGLYLLSCRDLAGIDLLPELVRVGVDSLKIEGRMKRPEYVATVVSTYRKALDSLAKRQGLGLTDQDREEFAQIFNRGFTTGYLKRNPGTRLITYGKPSNRGLPLGTVQTVGSKRQRASISLDRPLRVGDGIEYQGLGGLVVRFIDGPEGTVDKASPGETVWVESVPGVKPGDRVYKTSDVDLLLRARRYFQGEPIRKVDIWFHVAARVGSSLRLTVWDGDGRTETVVSEYIVERARRRSTSRDDIQDKLSRLGDTPYRLAGLEVDMDRDVMVPFSELNTLRREAVAKISAARLKDQSRPPLQPEHVQEVFRWVRTQQNTAASQEVVDKPCLAVKVADWEAAKAAWEAGADTVYLGGELFSSAREYLLDPDFWRSAGTHRGGNLVLTTPRIISDSEMSTWQKLAETALSNGTQAVLTGNLGFLHWAVSKGFPVCGDYYLNVFNSQAVGYLADLGLVQVALSVELTLRQIRDIRQCLLGVPQTAASGKGGGPWIHDKFRPVGIFLEIVVHGDLPMMVTEHPLTEVLTGQSADGGGKAFDQERRAGIYYLKDRKGILLPVEQDQSHRAHIFNGAELNLADSAAALWKAGVSCWRIEGQRYDPKRVAKVVGGYRGIIDRLAVRQSVPQQLIDQVTDQSREKTKGHYFRGVE